MIPHFHNITHLALICQNLALLNLNGIFTKFFSMIQFFQFRNKADYENLSDDQKSLFIFDDPNILESFHTPIKAYIDSRVDYEQKISANEWSGMIDYLKHYNCVDSQILCQAFMNFVNLFIEEFQVSPLDSISMPTLASKISWQFYDPKCYAIFSYSKEFGFLNEEIRSYGLNGGLVSKFFLEIYS